MIRKESMAAGFSVALGVAGLLLLLFLLWRLLGAIAAMITPFLVALVLAILLDPVADRLEQGIPNGWKGPKRLWAVVFVFLGLLLVLAGLLAFILPNLIAQTSRLITFFAPLSYKVERTRADGRFIILDKEVVGSSYTVKGLQNGVSYRFRVVVSDSEGKQYLLTETSATPHSAPERKAATPKDSKDVAHAIKNADRSSSTQETSSTADDYAAAFSTLPIPRPHVSATPPVINIFAPLSHPASPSPSPAESPAVEETDDTIPDISPPSRTGVPSTSSGQQNESVTEGTTGTGGTETPGSTPQPATAASPTNAARGEGNPLAGEPSPIATVLVPLAVTSPAPRPTTSTVGHILPAHTTPTPESTEALTPETAAVSPTPIATTPAGRTRQSEAAQPAPTPTIEPTPGTTTNKAAAATVRLPEPGTVLAVPGDGSVLLYWQPPVQAASGFDRLRTQADQWLLEHHSIGPLHLPPNLAAIQAQYSAQLSQVVQQISQRAADIIVGSVSTALTVTLSLIIGFYLLVDFDRLRMRMFHLIPEQARGGVLRIITDVSAVFGNYVRGMSTVAAFYGLVSIGTFFALGMVFDIGLKQYALLLGVVAGVLYPVPFLGPIMTTVVVTAVALATGATPIQAVAVAGTVQIQNGIFDNGVTPRVVGNSVGLHPLVTIFSLLLGGQLFGLLGMLLAVPVAASLQKLLIRLYPHLGEPTPMILQHPDRKEKKREGMTAESTFTSATPEAEGVPLP
jgi:predicted PurR-regulated permease PerM